MAEALAAGHAKFWLEGEKLTGGWTLQRTRGGAKPQWLLIKRRDEGADARRNPQSTQPESVKTGRTIEQVAAGRARGERAARPPGPRRARDWSATSPPPRGEGDEGDADPGALQRSGVDLRAQARRDPLHRRAHARPARSAALAQRPVAQRPLSGDRRSPGARQPTDSLRRRRRGRGVRRRGDQLRPAGRSAGSTTCRCSCTPSTCCGSTAATCGPCRCARASACCARPCASRTRSASPLTATKRARRCSRRPAARAGRA